LFSDFMGFTEISSSMDPSALVTELNSLFSEFDVMCERTQVEKIKTIGDGYMTVGGLPGTRQDHRAAVGELALGMVEAISGRPGRSGAARDWRVRIGIHTGPAVAGVIGTRKFVYDVWGDTVNVASRLETSAEPNRIHVSEDFANAVRDTFRLEPRAGYVPEGNGHELRFRAGG
jgi:class 3 adenylate cyclase